MNYFPLSHSSPPQSDKAIGVESSPTFHASICNENLMTAKAFLRACLFKKKIIYILILLRGVHPYDGREVNAASLMQVLHLTSINLQGKRRGGEDLGSRWEKRMRWVGGGVQCHGWQNKRLLVAPLGPRGPGEWSEGGDMQLKLKTGCKPEFGSLLRVKIFTSVCRVEKRHS